MRRARANPESEFQQTVAVYLSRALPTNIPWTAFPAGGGGLLRGARLKAMGLKPGWPDIIMLASRFVGLELKSKWGRVSDDQTFVHALIRAAGGAVYVPRTLEEVQAALLAEKISLRVKISA